MLNLWRLKILKELADLGTMSAVANALRVTRPAVSQHLAQLEREVGVALIERSTQGVRLTEAGMRLAAQSRELLAHVAAIEADIEHARGRVSGPLRIAAFGTFATAIVPQFIKRLQRQFIELTPSFVELEPTDAVKSVLSQQIDIAIVDDQATLHISNSSLDFLPLLDDQFLAVLSKSHPLAKRSVVQLRDLANEQWVINETAADYHGLLMSACWTEGFTPNVVCSTRSAATATSFVQSGWTVAVLPGLASVAPYEGVVYRPLEPNLPRKISAAIRRGSMRHPVIAAGLNLLRETSLEFPNIQETP